MTSDLVSRPGRWALPPQPPEAWTRGPAALALLLGVVITVVLLPALQVRTDLRAAVPYAGLLVLQGTTALLVAYLLLLHCAITQDRRLDWAAGGFVLLWLVSLARALGPAVDLTAPATGSGTVTTALAVAWLLCLPVVSLSAALRRRSMALLAVPAVLVLSLAAGVGLLPVRDGGRLTSTGEQVLLAVTGLGVIGALWWRQRVPFGNRRAWGWVGAGLLLTPVVAVLRMVTDRRAFLPVWLPLAMETTVLLLTLLGLTVLTARGFWPQSRRWHQLETEVRQLRSASPLLPGLSVTPLDEAGLPARAELAEVVAEQRVHVALQPVRDLLSGEAVGQEALARFGGRIPTDRWFHAAAVHGLGTELEIVTLTAALDCLPDLPATQFLAVNTSPASLGDPSVLALLHGADLSRVVVEITEHDAVRDYGLLRETMATLRRAGAQIAVDDVGAGFASLRHVLQLQPDVVKLDTSLTRDVHLSERQRSLVRAVVTFADEVGALVLAEGIEIGEQVSPLVDAGVTLGQGWHLGRPVICR